MEITLKLSKNVHIKDCISFYVGRSMIGRVLPSGKKYFFTWLWYEHMPAAFRDISAKTKKAIIKKLETEYIAKLGVFKEYDLTSITWKANIEF